eukprot:469466_1
MCSSLALTVSILYPLLDIIAIGVTAYILYDTVQHHKKEQNKLIKAVIWIYATALLYIVIRTPVDIFTCVDKSHALYRYPKYVRQLLYPINWCCLIWLSYKRILQIFNHESFSFMALSNTSRTIFKTIYFSMFIVPIILLIFYLSGILKYSSVLIIAGAIFVLSLIILSIWLMILYGYKLSQFFKQTKMDANNTSDLSNKLLKMIIRYYILCTISLLFSICSLFVYIALFSIDNEDVDELLTGIFLMDVCSNVFCTYLQHVYKISNEVYYKICGPLHSFCSKSCDKTTNQRNIALEINNSASNPTGGITTASNPTNQRNIALEINNSASNPTDVSTSNG